MKIFAFLAVTVLADNDATEIAAEATLLANQDQANADGVTGVAHNAGACFTCNAFGANTADTYAKCNTDGEVLTCPTENSLEEGEKLCFLDITRNAAGEVTGVNTGCKDRVACIDDSRQNFVGGRLIMSQCKPDPTKFMRNSRFGRANGKSLCRTCMLACDGDGTRCFRAYDSAADGIDGIFIGTDYAGAPGTDGLFNTYPEWYPGALLKRQVDEPTLGPSK